MFVNTQAYSIHTDHLGTPKAITNQNQEMVWSIEMDTFGETKQIKSKDNFTFNLRFAGQYFDQESGYHYNYHRYYDPQTGRYLTSDPIGLNGGSLNTYAYVDNEIWGLVAGGGGIYEYYTLWSECIGGRKGFARVKTFGSAVGFGATIGGGGGLVVLEDGRDDFDLNVFNGQYKKAGYGFGFGLTVGGALIQLGEARTDLSSLSPSLGAGWDNSIIGTVGWSKVVTGRVTVCGCS